MMTVLSIRADADMEAVDALSAASGVGEGNNQWASSPSRYNSPSYYDEEPM